jgi:hypothetical protein
LENKVFVIVANFLHVGKNKIVENAFPLLVIFVMLNEVIHFFLSYISIENFLVNSIAESGRHTSLGKLNQVRLVVF